MPVASRISVLIRCYNNAATIDRALESVVAQTWPQEDIEIIVVDDGSGDDSLAKIIPWQKQVLFFQTNKLGAVPALNFALAQATSRWFLILDGDDRLPPQALADLHQVAVQNSAIAAVYGNYEEVVPNSPFTCFIDTSHNMFSTVAGGILLDREKVLAVGGYDEAFFFPEYDLLLKLQEHHKICYANCLAYCYCRHNQSLTANQDNVTKGIAQLTNKYHRDLMIRRY